MSAKQYQHIFFDLDHTLWDYSKNTQETLLELFEQYKLDELLNTDSTQFYQHFNKVNGKLWIEYDNNQVTKEGIRERRFKEIFLLSGITDNALAQKVESDFLNICPNKPHLIEHSIEVLQYLSKKYTLHIITNGFDETQSKKLVSCGIRSYFDKIITSETYQIAKPNPSIYLNTIADISANNVECIMVGDNLVNDVLAAKNANIDQVYFNIHGIDHNHEITYEIVSLIELKNIF